MVRSAAEKCWPLPQPCDKQSGSIEQGQTVLQWLPESAPSKHLQVPKQACFPRRRALCRDCCRSGRCAHAAELPLCAPFITSLFKLMLAAGLKKADCLHVPPRHVCTSSRLRLRRTESLYIERLGITVIGPRALWSLSGITRSEAAGQPV